MELNKTAIGIAAGVAGTLFLGYCIYFDSKRRKDPDYKKKVRERRRKIRKNASNSSRSSFPNFHDQAAVERYFSHEIQLGETYIERGDYESGVEHLANAVIVCAQPTRLLQVLQSSLPAQVFSMLIYKMHEIGTKSNIGSSSANGGTLNVGGGGGGIKLSANPQSMDAAGAAGDGPMDAASASSVLIDNLD